MFDIPADQLARMKQLEDTQDTKKEKETKYTDKPFIKVFEIIDGKVETTKVVPKGV